MDGGPAKDKVTLVSAEGVEFVLDTEIAFLSRTLKTFFDGEHNFREWATRRVELPVRAKTLGRIIEFMVHKHSSADNLRIAEFKIQDDETMELLDVASYLRI